MQAWLSSSLVRHYPGSRPRKRARLTLHAVRGESVSFQVVFRTGDQDQKVTASAAARKPAAVRVRRVGYVPLAHFSTETPPEELDGLGHLPGLAPDPLFPESEMHAGPHETNAFWINADIPIDARPGRYPVTVTLAAEGGEPVPLTAMVRVHRGTLAARRDFPVTHWFYADALCDWYQTELWQESFWPLLNAYLRDLARHGLDTSHIPAFTPPTDGVKRPTQLLGVSRQASPRARVRGGERYTFDWALVRRWVKAAQAQGLPRLEWNHLFTQWGAKHAIRVYQGHGEDGKLLWPAETLAVSPVYRDFLSQFLPALRRFLEQEGLTESSFFHLSDEPHGEEHLANYRAARQMLRELAPWMKVMDALSQIQFARERLTDIPIPILDEAPQFVREGFPAWTYFCSGPRGRYLNRLLDTPLAKIRMSGWLFYKNRARGFLHWGYNYWYRSQTTELIDPYQVNDACWWPGWAPGDPFQVYPGPAGPVDSMRWEVWGESLQEYALLQTAGLDPDDPLLASIRDYRDFPKQEGWIRSARRELIPRLGK
jgi:hypothetical protein